jgi:hypothetical protein
MFSDKNFLQLQRSKFKILQQILQQENQERMRRVLVARAEADLCRRSTRIYFSLEEPRARAFDIAGWCRHNSECVGVSAHV